MKHLMKALLIAAPITTLTGCMATADNTEVLTLTREDVPQVALVQLERDLKDPDSVKYRSFLSVRSITYDDGKDRYCIEYNAKNSYGGMAGYSWAMWVEGHGLITGSVSDNSCTTYYNISTTTN